jgi:ABC-type multidrug transport system permease subunit
MNPSNTKIKIGVCNFDSEFSSEEIFRDAGTFEPILLNKKNCSENLKEEIRQGKFPVGIILWEDFSSRLEELKQSRIDVYYDNSDIAFANLISWKLDLSMQPFEKKIINSLNLELKNNVKDARAGIGIVSEIIPKNLIKKVEEIDGNLKNIEEMETEFILNPIWTFHQGVYEENSISKTSIAFILPIILLFTILMLSSTSLIYDRKNNFISRVKTSTSLGVYLFAKLIFFFALALVQTLIILGVYAINGNFYWVNFFYFINLLLFISIINSLVGLLIGIISENEGIAILFSLIIAFPLMLLSGIFYPLQTVSPILKTITQILPLHYEILFAKQVFIFGSELKYNWLIPAIILFVIVWVLIRKKED